MEGSVQLIKIGYLYKPVEDLAAETDHRGDKCMFVQRYIQGEREIDARRVMKRRGDDMSPQRRDWM